MILQAILRAHRAKGKDDSLWGVARVEVVESSDGLRPGEEITAKGDLIRAAAVGELLRLEGEVVSDPKWGRQLQVDRQESLGIQRDTDAHRWLERLDGVGPVMARRIYDAFKGRVLEVLRAAPDVGPDPLLEVDGIGPSLARTIRESWGQIGSQGDPETLATLDALGLTRWEVNGVIAAAKKAGEAPVDFIRTNPYRLIGEKGFAFLRADNVALKAGVHREAPARLDAAVVHVVGEVCEQNTVAPVGRLVSAVGEAVGVREQLVVDAIYRVARAGDGGLVLSKDGEVDLVHPRSLLLDESTIYGYATGAAAEEVEGLPAGPKAETVESDPPTVVMERPAELADLGDEAALPPAPAGAVATLARVVGRALPGAELARRAARHELACELAELPCFVPAGGECHACGRNVYELCDGAVPVAGCPHPGCGRSFCE